MEGCLSYLNDIIIYSGNTKAKHQSIVEKVLQQCIKYALAVNLFKSKYHVNETIFLSHVINGQEVKMDSLKLETMSKWPSPAKRKEVQAFLSFANYYPRLIDNYSTKTCPLIDLGKDIPFSWRHIQQQAFNDIQARFLSASILIQFNKTGKTIMETDASN